ncbi:hypothetical protein ABID22_001220 [Pontibacter aydingkolensis]|uniref:Uncharacterized protein n=1 Tax=Pontibacter aydingkolensis TaxID=1911536 RepID=A0ABS7CTE4_9BACT|nr:hypothetical protein [Pontibacter aydingkolensis]MBW7467126.1 hypothetical protein [Pontibacter aydingkolensis]
MKIPAIKKLVETYNLEELGAAENALMEEQPLTIEVEGDDEGEQLTHVYAAIWIISHMNANNVDFKTALREYTKKVRVSIN